MKRRFLVINSRYLLVFLLVSYAVVLTPFVDAALRNYLVLGAAMLGGLLFILLRLPLQRWYFWAIILFVLMAMRTYWLDGAGGLGSAMLTFVFALGYFAISSLLERCQDRLALIRGTMRMIIYAFAILSVLQLVTSLVGFPIPNLMSTKGLWSYNSLAYEPSQLGRVVGITMLCYLMLSRLPTQPGQSQETPKDSQLTFLAFLASMLLSGSALAAAAIVIAIVLSRSIVWAITILVISVLVWPLLYLIDFDPLQRMLLFLSALGTGDINELFQADGSGAVRIAPAMLYLDDMRPEEAGFWFGYGKEGLVRFFQGKLPGVRQDAITAGFLPGFAAYYGALMTFIFLWIFAFRFLFFRTTAPLVIFWFIFISSSPWNTQTFWYGLVVIQIAYCASHRNAIRAWPQLS